MSVNVAVIRGECSRPPEVRILPSGSALALFQVTTRAERGSTTSVPVALWDPPAWIAELGAGDEIVAVGRVRRRFFRGASGTASRVEVEAAAVARAGDRRRVPGLLRRAQALLDELAT